MIAMSVVMTRAAADLLGPSERLELARWRAAFTRDAVAGRLAALGPFLEREVRELEIAAADMQAGHTRQPASAPPESRLPLDEPPPAARPPAPPAPADIPPAPAPMLAGSIQEGLLADVLQMLSANLKTGMFRISGTSGDVSIWFDSGEVSHATVGSQIGEAAFFAGLASSSGSFWFVETPDIPPERTITGKTQFLILEGLRKMDEETQGAQAHGDE
jgi:uncharacterized protein DUF4388